MSARLRKILTCCLLLLFVAACDLGCHNDRKMIDKHEQILEEEGD